MAMAGGVSCSSHTSVRLPQLLHSKRIHGIRCSSPAPDSTSKNDDDDDNGHKLKKEKETPPVLKIAVSGVTELLRLFSSFNKPTGLKGVSDRVQDEFFVSGIDDVIMILKSDYENAYFITGIFTSEIYTEDCIFEDPTISFQGKDLYSRNLKLLVPFFDSPSIGLEKIEKGINSEVNFVRATWKLRTYLKLPWRPLICIDGSTIYDLDEKFKIVRHAESWNVSAIEAIGQLFTPSYGRSND